MDWVIYAIAHPALTQPPFGRGNLVSTDTIIANVVLALRVGNSIAALPPMVKVVSTV